MSDLKSVAYLVNTYPLVSQTFIRREIEALENLGVRVERYTVRKPDRSELHDPAQIREAERTRALLGRGLFPIFVASLSLLLTSPGRWARALRSAIRLGRGSATGLPRHLVYHAEACLLYQWLRQSPATHLHAHFGTNSTAVALLCCDLGGLPFSFTVHGRADFEDARRQGFQQKLASASFAVAVSEFGRSQLCRWCEPSLWPKIHIVRCGVDPMFLEHDRVACPQAPRLVSIGRLSKEKGHVVLVRAARALVESFPDLEIVLVGDGEERSEIEAECRELGLTDQVRIAGFLDGEGVVEEILAARAMVLPSFVEGLPVSIMESFALGRPVISTFVAGIPELVKPGVSGWLVPAGSESELSTAMREAIEASTEQLDEMGAAGARDVSEMHSVSREATRLNELFEA